jgi:hypothetical protein
MGISTLYLFWKDGSSSAGDSEQMTLRGAHSCGDGACIGRYSCRFGRDLTGGQTRRWGRWDRL